jgi:hypothetical protein
MRLSACVALVLALVSCGGQQSSYDTAPDAAPHDASVGPMDATMGSTPLPCDVDAVFAKNCRLCHTNPPLFAAPMPLVTYEDLHAISKVDAIVPVGASVPVYQQVGVRIHDQAHLMPQPPNTPLGATDLATLDAWIANGAPAGAGSCQPTMTPDAAAPGTDAPIGTDCVPDTLLRPATPFAMTGSEEYACYGVDVPVTGKRHVIQISPHLDNKQIVHHMLLLRSATSVSSTPTACDASPALGDGMLYAWAPGGNPLIVPAAAGFPEDQSTHYMVQIHYNNAANVPNPTDSSGFDMCTTSTLRPNDADVIAFGSEAIFLFPHASGTVTSCFGVPSTLDGAHFFAAFPHMHELGTSIASSLVPAGDAGPVVDMGNDPAWDFSMQPWLAVNAVPHTGDTIRTQCIWNNTTANIVTFGQSTTNEMCFTFSAYYPSLGANYAWAAPATASVPCP